MYMSFDTLHQLNKTALPSQIMRYKLFNNKVPQMDWVQLNFDQILSSLFWNNNWAFIQSWQKCIGKPFVLINNEIDLDWLNLSLEGYKIKCKVRFLK